MTECGYCDEDFSSEKEKLEHEMAEHDDEMSGHDKDSKKSKLNKLEQKEKTTKHNKKKKMQYGAVGLIMLLVLGGGGFYAVQNLDLDGVEETNESIGVGTPVHWHADYQLSVCGDRQILQGGPTRAHTHGQSTFHMEGVRQNKEEATLEWIVDQLGGELEENSVMGRESCNGEPANLTVSANGEELENHLEYIPRDGDLIEITYE